MNVLLLSIISEMNTPEIYNAMYMDPLTNALNRRAFDILGANCEKVAIVDLDSLKWVNDNYGHRVGDQQLVSLASLLITQFGPDNVFRVSGDEFVVISYDQMNVLPLGEELEIELRNIRAEFDRFSFGVGPTIESADESLRDNKLVREMSGSRSERGVKPPWEIKLRQERLTEK